MLCFVQNWSDLADRINADDYAKANVMFDIINEPCVLFLLRPGPGVFLNAVFLHVPQGKVTTVNVASSGN